jgi:hypothetical protein
MAAGTFTAVGQANTFVKDHNATGRMITGYSRNAKDFGLPRYTQVRKVSKESGYYLQLDQYNAMRLTAGGIDEYVWPDGQPRPVLNNNLPEFRYLDYRTVRRNFGQQMGMLAVQQADWDLSSAQENSLSQKAMTARTRQAHQALALSTNWDASHRADVTAIPSGGQWSAALSTTPYIRRSINHAITEIMKDTGSTIKQEDLLLIINPTTAFLMSQTQEVIDHLKQSPFAYDQIRGGGRFSRWGLPDQLFGVNLHVEDSVMVTSPRGAAAVTRQFVMPDAVAYILSRPGGIEAPVGGPTFSTLTTFALEEMTVEKKTDEDNRLIDSNVVDNVVTVLTAPSSGFAFLNLY